MKVRSLLAGAALLAAIAFTPSQVSAQGVGASVDLCSGSSYSATLGLGGTLSGCFGFTLRELGENAYFNSRQFYWNGNFAGQSNAGPSNGPTVSGTEFFTDECGSSGSGGSAAFAFCPVDAAHTTTGNNLSGEFVLGLLVPDPTDNVGNPYWQYSGPAARNAFPAPAGFQQVLYQLTLAGNPVPGEYLFAWEDLNTGCLAVFGSASHPSLTTYATEDLGDKVKLDDPNNCNPPAPGGPSDADYNDSYIRLSIIGNPQSVVPEPMTMTLMATGLVGLAGAQIRRRKKN